MKNKLLPAFSVFLVLLACIGTAAADDFQPVLTDSVYDTIAMLPDSFYGTIVMPDDQPVPANQIVEVTGQGIMTGEAGNPLLTHEGGFGGSGAMDGKLLAQGHIEPGTPLSFTVGGVPARVYLVSDSASGWQDTTPFVSGDLQEVILMIDTTLTPGPVPTGVYIYPAVTGNQGSVVAYSDSTGGTTTGSGTTTGGVANPASVPAYTTPPTRVPGASGTSAVSNQQPGAALQSGDNTAGSPGLVQAQAPAGQPIPTSWYIGGILIIVIIALGGYYYGRTKKENPAETNKKE